MEEGTETTPTQSPVSQRIDNLDLVRGFAICGLAPVNILDFSTSSDWTLLPGNLAGANYYLWLGVAILAMGKFISLFSLLFGAGIILQTRRMDGMPESTVKAYLPRLGWLLMFGMLHAYLIWHGDILTGYAVTGFLVFWCRNWTAKSLAVVGLSIHLTSIVILSALSVSLGVFGEEYLEQATAEWTAESEEEETGGLWNEDVYAGSWLEQTPLRLTTALIMQLLGIPFIVAPFCGSLMLIGMALLKAGFFEGKSRSVFYIISSTVGLALGLVLTCSAYWLIDREDWSIAPILCYIPLTFIGTPLMALGYAAVLTLWGRTGFLPLIQAGLRAIGRMAFSNYIGQSLIFAFIFYGYGLGYYNQLSLGQILLIPPGVWIFQMIVSSLWLKTFRYGPLEWVWRCLTYRKQLPLMK